MFYLITSKISLQHVNSILNNEVFYFSFGIVFKTQGFRVSTGTHLNWDLRPDRYLGFIKLTLEKK